jgi:hypothetical protein
MNKDLFSSLAVITAAATAEHSIRVLAQLWSGASSPTGNWVRVYGLQDMELAGFLVYCAILLASLVVGTTCAWSLLRDLNGFLFADRAADDVALASSQTGRVVRDRTAESKQTFSDQNPGISADIGTRPPAGLAKAVLRVLERWDIADSLGAVILGATDGDFVDRLRSDGRNLATRDTQDRARLLLDIYEGVHALLREPEAERDWIRAPRTDFSGRSVLDLMTAGSQRNLIRAQAFVDYANGR